jgi:hypothetical protein
MANCAPWRWAQAGVLAEVRARDRTEYAGHGEHLGVTSGAGRFCSPNWQLAAGHPPDATGGRKRRERTLLIARLHGGPTPEVASIVMCDHGALAIKDVSGHWHFSLHKDWGLRVGQA